MDDALGDRMKEYENITRYYLPKKSYVLARIDGKAFHTYTKGLTRPFDLGLISDMNETAKYLVENIQGARFAYVQSDEISLLITDFVDGKDNRNTESWFGNNLQKMNSISASFATSKFNQLRITRFLNEESTINEKFRFANFDSRFWIVPKRSEVINYFIYRQQDATRNSIQSIGQSFFSEKELKNQTIDKIQDMVFQKTKINWNDYSAQLKRGRGVVRVEKEVELNLIAITKAKQNAKEDWIEHDGKIFVKRKTWEIADVPIFTKDKEFFNNIIPLNF